MTYQALDTTAPSAPPSAPSDATALDVLIEDHYAAETQGDLARLLETFANDVEHDVVGSPGVVHGKDAVRAFYTELLDDLRLDEIRSVRRFHGEGFVVDESMVTAKAVGSPFGLPGGGRTVRFRLLHVFEFRGGAIARENAWIDVAGVLAQLAE